MTLVPAAVFSAVALLVWVVMDIFVSEDRRVSQRLQGLSVYEAAEVREMQPLLQSFSDRIVRPAGQGLLQFSLLFQPLGYRDRLRDRLSASGHPRGIHVERFLIAKTVMLVGVTGLTLLIWLVSGLDFGRGVLFVAVSAALAFYAPDIWLRNVISRRRHEIVRSLPDLLDMLTISVEAGLGFDQAVAKVVKNTDGALAEELGRMLQEVQSGLSRKEALRALAARADVPELTTFTSALVQADIFGISTASVLRVQSKEMRVKRRQLAEEQAQKAPVKIVFPLVLCILPATFVVILGPAIISIGQAFGLM